MFFVTLPFALLGLFVIFHVLRPQRKPADSSNRINKLRLLWFALTREDLFTKLFPWLLQDEIHQHGASVTADRVQAITAALVIIERHIPDSPERQRVITEVKALYDV